jgi:hypothetical protein
MTVALSSTPEGARRTVLPQRPHTEMRAAIADTGAQLASRHRARLMRRVAQSKSLARVSTVWTGRQDTRPIVVCGLPRVAVAHPYRHAAVEIDIVPCNTSSTSVGAQRCVGCHDRGHVEPPRGRSSDSASPASSHRDARCDC